jgi:hypothetical protein
VKFSGNRGHFLGAFFSGYGDRALMRIALGNLLAPVNNKSPEQMLSYALPILNPPLFNPLYLHRLWLVICSFEHMYTDPINDKESGSLGTAVASCQQVPATWMTYSILGRFWIWLLRKTGQPASSTPNA